MLTTFISVCTASGGYSGSGSASGEYGGGSLNGYGGSSGGGSFSMSADSNYGQSGGGQVIPAAVQSRHQVEFRDVPSTGSVNPTTIEVGANSVPLNILFRSASSNLNIQQAHDGAQGSTQETSSEDEPHRLIHSVTKPIIQEVREVITPYRKITQEIKPVQEEILTIVARGNEQSKGYDGMGSGAGDSAGYGSEKGNGGLVGAMKQQMGAYGGGGGRKSY